MRDEFGLKEITEGITEPLAFQSGKVKHFDGWRKELKQVNGEEQVRATFAIGYGLQWADCPFPQIYMLKSNPHVMVIRGRTFGVN